MGCNLELQYIDPLTKNQSKAFESGNNLMLHGSAGTGKTFISSYLAYDDISKRSFNKLVIIRSAVPTRDMGFLPGTDKEKSAVYEEPYKNIASDLFGNGSAYEILKKHNIVQFMTTSFIRGVTIENAVVLVDECQNMSFHELDSIITRMGENCRLIFCGDFKQSDLGDKNGLDKFIKIIKIMDRFTFIDFGVNDIVRSDFVKNYIICKETVEK